MWGFRGLVGRLGYGVWGPYDATTSPSSGRWVVVLGAGRALRSSMAREHDDQLCMMSLTCYVGGFVAERNARYVSRHVVIDALNWERPHRVMGLGRVWDVA